MQMLHGLCRCDCVRESKKCSSILTLFEKQALLPNGSTLSSCDIANAYHFAGDSNAQLRQTQAMVRVLSIYGYHDLEMNFDLMPNVADFTPPEYVSMLTDDERAYLIDRMVRYANALREVEHIDVEQNVDALQPAEAALMVRVIEARHAVREAVSNIVDITQSVIARSFPFDPGGHCCSHISLHSLSQPNLSTVTRRRTVRRQFVDICSGQQSLAQYILLCDPTAEILSLDVISYRKALSELPSHLHSRIKYVEYDVVNLTLSELQRLVRTHLGCELSDVYGVHFSPCCKSYSSADGGWSDYRLPDGSPNPDARDHSGYPLPSRYEYACLWDRIVSVVLKTLDEFTTINPDAVITVENPTAMFRLHPSVVKLTSRSDGSWRLIEVDYCKAAHPRFDGDRVFTKKPTDFIIFGVRGAKFFSLPRCNHDCRYRFPDHTGRSKFHLRSIRIDRKSPLGQVKQLGSLRHAIPCALFHIIFEEHEQWLASRVGAASLVIMHAPMRERDVLVNLNLRSRRKLSEDVFPDAASQPTDPSAVSDSAAGGASKNSAASRRSAPIVDKGKKQVSGNLTREQRLYLLLHYRFGHASFKRLKSLLPYESIISKKNRVECPVCMSAKATAKPHVGRLLRMAYALGLVHFDIQGPFRVADLDGCRYNLVLVDDHTDFKWLYRLRSKDELGPTLRLWIAYLGVCPERFRHDGAGENLGANGMNSVTQICYERCIYPERTVPYNPEQLTRVERVNRVFLECARCLLLTTPGATIELHGYAFLHACYLDQFLGTSVDQCPYTRWYGQAPSAELLNSLRVWGSIVYFKHHEDRHKLDMPGHKGMFLGYSNVSDGVYIRDLDNKKKPVRITRDVLARSYNEQHHIVREPLAVTVDEFKLLEQEPSTPMDGESRDQPWESILFRNVSNVDENLHKYYRAYQSFAKDRRALLCKNPDLSPDSIESMVKKEWRTIQFDAAKRAKFERAADKLASEVQHALDVEAKTDTAPTRDSGGASGGDKRASDSMPSSASSKRAKLSGDTLAPARASARTTSSGSKSTSTSSVEAEVSSKQDKSGSSIDHIPCESCGGLDPSRGNAILVCDGCNKGFHQFCYKISVLPLDADDWLCHSCLQPGMRISVYFKRDKQWHDGIVTAQHAKAMGTDVAYDNGTRALEFLNAMRWRPIYERSVAPIVAHILETDSPLEEAQNIAIWLATTPKSLAHLKRFPKCLQDRWQKSRLKEFTSIIGKGAAEVVDRSEVPANAVVVPCTWVFRLKVDGSLKSRMCLLGNLMPKDDVVDISSPTPRLSSLRIVLTLAVKFDLCVQIVDIDTAFTYAQPGSTIYCSLPGGLYDDGRLEGKYLHLLRCLYGADTAPRMWHNLIHNWFISEDFSTNPHEPCLYQKWVDGVPIFVLVWVDDCTVISTAEHVKWLVESIAKVFNIKDLGPLGLNPDGSPSILLGMEFRRTSDEFQIRQDKLVDTLVAKAGTELNAIPHEKVPIRDVRLQPCDEDEHAKWKHKAYRSFLGIIGYLMLGSYVECAYAYKELARFNHCYGREHWETLMRLISYLKKAKVWHYLSLSKHGGLRLYAFCDSDWNGSDQCLSTTSWIVFLGNSPISWCSRMQRSTSRSTGEAEFLALSSCSQEALYLQMFVASLDIPTSTFEIFGNDRSRYEEEGVAKGVPAERYATAVKIWSDSKVALAQAKKPEHWIVDKLRHVRTAYFFFKSYVRRGKLELHSVPGTENPSNVGTKGFGAPGKTAANQQAEYFEGHALTCLGRPRLARFREAAAAAAAFVVDKLGAKSR